MSVFTYHLVKTDYFSALRILFSSPKSRNIPGLIHAEIMTVMTLGSPIFSPSRMLIRQIAVFAQWENENDIENFLAKDNLGKILSEGWHTRLTFMRKWGKFNKFEIPDVTTESENPDSPVVAVTIARMKFLEIPRFIHWGRPVEKLVRDHPATTLSLASIKFPNTVSTFSIWKNQKEMTDMVHGHSKVPKPKRHSDAMKERDRKDFHFEFTTLRFKPISEFGEWNEQRNIIPNLKNN
ncbi:hypothetical protein PYS58_14305 [Chryseobacterium indologenes]|uniref:hypothetical protein n=1 Tax=Chryseobacterium indologenes TaxID=253 RepID=UPI0023E7F85D|nr:hypothetical protein [Chryseobacterium indologenes]WET47748.1 hypothetical protein PYS58_14305 [Chryseobacterium indologenes]